MPNQFAAFQSKIAYEAMLREYEAIYKLAEFRLGALDRRIPLIGGVLTGFLSVVPVLPGLSQVLGLIAIPVTLIWLVRTTITHARSFEDAIRAIEGIEQRINALVGQQVLSFQSTHPSRNTTVGGRTGSETVTALSMVSSLLLGMSLWMGISIGADFQWFRPVYAIYIACISFVLIRSVWVWGQYQYQSELKSS